MATATGGAAVEGGAATGGAISNGGSPGAGGSESEATGGTATGSGGLGTSPEALQAALKTAEQMDGAAVRAAYPMAATTDLGYDATQASGLEQIQASSLSLSDAELAGLAENGVAISKTRTFPSFSYGYKSIYLEDLPVFVSADSILEAVHQSFDALLKRAEERVMLTGLQTLLSSMRARIPSVIGEPQTARDADLYLSVALELSKASFGPDTVGEVVPVTDLDPAEITEFVELAKAASGHGSIELFGLTRDEDFSQFKPRGHYTESAQLSAYFKMMIWLGRVDLRLIETQPSGEQIFDRRSFDVAVALRRLMDTEQFERWRKLEGLIGAFVGERDSMSPEELDGLMTALGMTLDPSSAELGDEMLSDEKIAAEIQSGGWGEQRIASRILVHGGGAGDEALPLDRSFLLFGQRYTVDSHAFVNTTYDRIPDRMMPNPLDAAFVAMKNNFALSLLSADLGSAAYAGGLAKTRVLVDAHDQKYWEGSAYTRWLDGLSKLSPSPGQELAGIARTDAWERRILNAQMGSWAELRHNTVLYTKQSYTTGNQCEFPDAYVDPYPEFYQAMARLAEHLVTVIGAFPEVTISVADVGETLAARAQTWATTFVGAMGYLEQMAKNQQAGVPHTQEQLDFINAGVNWGPPAGCNGLKYGNLTGWYFKLFTFEMDAIEYDPNVTDAHTQPTDGGGADVGRILHVGTGEPRLMVVTANTCMGPRAYAGLAFSYGELITNDWLRLTDDEWSKTITADGFPDVPWMSSVTGN